MKKDTSPNISALEALYGNEAFKTFEIFYRFKEAGLSALFEDALNLYDKDPKVIRFLLENWKKQSRQREIKKDKPEYDDYEDNIHKVVNDEYARDAGIEDPSQAEFIKFDDRKKISENPIKFKEAVLRFLAKHKLNQKKLAVLMDVSTQAVSQFFTSDKAPRPTTLRKLQNALGVTGVWIYYPDSDKEA